MTDKLSEDGLLYWFNKYWVFPKPSHEHWKPTSQAYQQIVAMIKSHPNLNQNMAQSKVKVTEEWIEEKTDKLYVNAHGYLKPRKYYRNFIRSLIGEVQ